jgi:hypothetical protein
MRGEATMRAEDSLRLVKTALTTVAWTGSAYLHLTVK